MARCAKRGMIVPAEGDPAPPQHRGSLPRIASWLRALPDGDAAASRYLFLLRSWS